MQILKALVLSRGGILSRDQLIEATDNGSDTFDRTIDSHVSHLRVKLKTLTLDHFKIVAEYGYGYRLRKEEIKK